MAIEDERKRVERVYRTRHERKLDARYLLFQKGTLQIVQEREWVLLSMLKGRLDKLADKQIIDIGCGRGGTLIPFLLYGAKAENCFGVDILKDHIEAARKQLPAMTFVDCSGESIPFEKGTFDLVTMFTCLSSVLDNGIRQRICKEAFAMLRPGGWVLIYDLRVNNPFNKDVCKVTLRELKEYFPNLKCISKTLTLIPYLSRVIGRYSMTLCGALSLLPFLRTHRMTMFQKKI